MSLTKQVLQPSGFTVEYWRVSNISINPIEKTLNVNLLGYKDLAAYDLGYEAAVSTSFSLDKEEFLALTTPGVVAGAKSWLQIVDTIVAEVYEELNGSTEDPLDVI